MIEFHLYAAVCNFGSYMQLNLWNLDTKTGYHQEISLRFDESGQSGRPSGFCLGTDLELANNCTASA